MVKPKKLNRTGRRKLARETASGKSPTARPLPLTPSLANTAGTETESHPRLGKLLRRIAAFCVAVAGVAGTAIAAWPHIQIFPSTELADPLHAFNVPFTLHNAGNLPLYDLEIQCAPHDVQTLSTELGVANKGKQIPAFIGNRRVVAEKVMAGEDKPFTCNVFDFSVGIYRVTSADMPMLVRFRPVPFIPLTWPAISKSFITSRQPDGRLQWHEFVPPLNQAPPKYPMR